MSAPAEVLAIATPFVKQREGFVGHPEPDGKGIPTEGYGFIASDFPGDRMPAHMTEPQASAMLSVKLGGVYYQPIADLIREFRLVLNPYEQAGFLSFVFNLGPGYLGPQHTIGHLLRLGDIKGAINSMTLYSDPNDPVDHEGLLRRREDEQALCRTPWDPNHYAWYDKRLRDVGPGRKAAEDETAREYDAKRAHWLRWPGRLRRLRRNCAWFVARLNDELAANHKHDPEGKDFHRAWRRDHLRARKNGKRVA